MPLFVCVASFVIGIILANNGMPQLLVVGVIVAIISGFVAYSMKDEYAAVITTSATEIQLVLHTDQRFISQIVDGINRAMVMG